MSRKKIVIVGGVAGGASCAARCRRLDESAEIIVIDRGPYVSFANCGLPYYVGDVIKDESKLLVANAALFNERFNIEVRTQNEALAIDRAAKEIEVKELTTGRVYRERYDALVLSPGRCSFAAPLCRAWILRGCSSCARSPTAAKIRGVDQREERDRAPSSLVRVSSDWKWPRTWRIAAFP